MEEASVAPLETAEAPWLAHRQVRQQETWGAGQWAQEAAAAEAVAVAGAAAQGAPAARGEAAARAAAAESPAEAER